MISRHVKIAIVFLIIFGVILAILFLRPRFHPNYDLTSASRSALARIDMAGGPEKICREADEIFREFGTTNLQFFGPTDISNYPSIASLGDVNGIFPGPPACISIKVGDHFTGFFIRILSTNALAEYVPSTNETRIGTRFFISR
jgi:hypothetical protein